MEHYLNISSFKHLSLTSKQNSFSVSWASLFSKSQLESSVPMKILCVSLCGCNFPQSPFKQNILRSFLIGVSKRKNAVGALCSHEKNAPCFFGAPFWQWPLLLFVRFTAKAPPGVGALLHLSFDDTTNLWGTLLGTHLRPPFGVRFIDQFPVSPQW